MSLTFALLLLWASLLGLAAYEAFRVVRGSDRFYFSVLAALRVLVAVAFIGLMATNINPGGDGIRYREAAQSLAFHSTTGIDAISDEWEDARYLPYIAISSYLELIGNTYFVSLFQAIVHLLGAILLYDAILKCTANVRTAKVMTAAYTFTPLLTYYSHVYLRDIYLSLASAWFFYALTRRTTRHILLHIAASLTVMACIRLQYIPFFLFGAAVYFAAKGGRLRYAPILLIGVICLFVMEQQAYYFSPERLVPYLIEAGTIEPDPRLAYASVNPIDYFTMENWLKTFIGLFGPFHFFYGPEYLLIEYRGDFIERFTEGLSGLVFGSLLTASLWIGLKGAGHRVFSSRISIWRQRRVLPTSLASQHAARVVTTGLTVFLLLSILLTFVGYNRWRMPLIPLYFVVAAALGVDARRLLGGLIVVTIALMISLIYASM